MNNAYRMPVVTGVGGYGARRGVKIGRTVDRGVYRLRRIEIELA